MSEIKCIPFSASLSSDSWLEFDDENAADLLQHLRSDNVALSRLRDALSADVEAMPSAEATHA